MNIDIDVVQRILIAFAGVALIGREVARLVGEYRRNGGRFY